MVLNIVLQHELANGGSSAAEVEIVLQLVHFRQQSERGEQGRGINLHRGETS
jgi:hypothetical protein